MRLLTYVFLALVVLIPILLGYAIYDEFYSEKISLRKSDWICTQTKAEISNIYIGGKLTPQVRSQCIKYQRK